MTGLARKIDGPNPLADSEEGEDVIQRAIALVVEPAGEMKSDVKRNPIEPEAGQRSAEDRRLFQQQHALAMLRENARGGQARDAAADDDGVE
jgi:hypothetical protein